MTWVLVVVVPAVWGFSLITTPGYTSRRPCQDAAAEHVKNSKEARLTSFCIRERKSRGRAAKK